MSTWSEAERTAIFVMATEYDLEWEEIQEIFGRMFDLGSKRQYHVGHIRDEYKQRFRAGKSKMWARIDTGDDVSQHQLQMRAQARQGIANAAARTHGTNSFGQACHAIALVPLNGRPAAPMPASQGPSQQSTALAPPAAPFASPPAQSTLPTPQVLYAQANQQQQDVDMPDAGIESDEDTIVVARPVKKSKQTLQQKSPTAPQSPPQDDQSLAKIMPLAMIHSCEIAESRGKFVLDKANSVVGEVDDSSAMYKLGGSVRRLTNGNGEILDTIMCSAKICKYCLGDPMSQTMANRVLLARAAENDASLQESSTKQTGKPFLHLLRDTDLFEGGRLDGPVTFSPRGSCTELLGETDTMDVVFDDRLIVDGAVGPRSATVCRPSSCSTCIQWSTVTSKCLPMIHSTAREWDDEEDCLMWRLNNRVGTVERGSRLEQYGGPTVQVKVVNEDKSFLADVTVCTDEVCSYCSHPPAGGPDTQAALKAARDSCNNPEIDVDASPYLLDGEFFARPFVHSVRDTEVTNMGREFRPRGQVDNFSCAIQPARILFEGGETMPIRNGGKGKGLRLASMCVFDKCPTCQAWVQAHPEDAPQ